MSQNHDAIDNRNVHAAVDNTKYDALARQFVELRRERRERAVAEFEALGRLCRAFLPYDIVMCIMEFHEHVINGDAFGNVFDDLVGRFARNPERRPVCIFPSAALPFSPLVSARLRRFGYISGISFSKFAFALRNVRHLRLLGQDATLWASQAIERGFLLRLRTVKMYFDVALLYMGKLLCIKPVGGEMRYVDTGVNFAWPQPGNARAGAASAYADCLFDDAAGDDFVSAAPHMRRCVRELVIQGPCKLAVAAKDCAVALRRLELYGARIDIADLTCALSHMHSLRIIYVNNVDRFPFASIPATVAKLTVVATAHRVATDGLPIQHLPKLCRLKVHLECHQTICKSDDLAAFSGALAKLEQILPWLVERRVTVQLHVSQPWRGRIASPEYSERALVIFNALNTNGLIRSFADYSTRWPSAMLSRMQAQCEQSCLREMSIGLQ